MAVASSPQYQGSRLWSFHATATHLLVIHSPIDEAKNSTDNRSDSSAGVIIHLQRLVFLSAAYARMATFYRGDATEMMKSAHTYGSLSDLLYIDPPFGTITEAWDNKIDWKAWFAEAFRVSQAFWDDCDSLLRSFQLRTDSCCSEAAQLLLVLEQGQYHLSSHSQGPASSLL
jgi:hypothetical protein